MKPKSVTFLSTSLTRAGAETQVMRIASQLSQRGWDVSVISMLPPEAFVGELTRSGVRVASLDMRRGIPDPRAFVKCVALLREWRPRVLVTYMVHANLLGRVAAVLPGMPTVISSVRSQWFGGAAWDLVMRLTDRLAAATVTNSSIVAEDLIRRRVASVRRLRVIPNGLRVEDFAPSDAVRKAVRTELAIEDQEFLWLSAARLEVQKDHTTLLEAFARVVAREPDVRLLVAGMGTQQETLQSQAAALNLSERVQFLGLRDDIPRLLVAADALVLSSAWEGLPNIVMEALASSVPIVATEVGGVPELVLNGETGLLVPPGDAKVLARNMLKMVEMSTESREQMGSAGRQHVSERMGLGRVVDQWESLLQELTEQA